MLVVCQGAIRAQSVPAPDIRTLMEQLANPKTAQPDTFKKIVELARKDPHAREYVLQKLPDMIRGPESDAWLDATDPHIDQRGGQPEHEKILDCSGDHSRCCAANPAPKYQAYSEEQEAAENNLQRMHSEILPRSARPLRGQHKVSVRLPAQCPVG